MKNFALKIKNSAREITKLRSLTVCGMLAALYVLSAALFDFYPTASLKISFGFLFIAAAGYLYGPLPAALVGGIGDFLVAFTVQKGGAWIFGITLCMMAMGFIFGLVYYNEHPTLPRVIIACVSEMIVVELGLKSWVLAFTYGTTFTAQLAVRLLPATIICALMCVLSFTILKVLIRIKK